jgi:hypothetical protein
MKSIKERLGMIDDETMENIVEFALSRYPESGERIDWDDLLYRIEDRWDLDLGTDLLSAEITAIKKAVRKGRREAQA